MSGGAAATAGFQTTEPAINPVKGDMGGQMNGQSVDRLMDIILQMKINLSHISETLQEQTFEIREQLAVLFDEEKQNLERYRSLIDEKLTDCSNCVRDHQRLHAGLSTMREKLVQLGAEPSSIPPGLPEESVESIIAWRLRELKEQGKL